MKRIIGVGIAAALTAALALGAGNELLTRGPLDSPLPTPTATARPFGLTPRPTSTGLAPRPATPTPQTIAATPGPCTVAIHERSVTCKTAYRQPVTWTLRITTTLADQRVVTSSLFDFTSRAVFTPALTSGSVITISPRWQPERGISVITLTGQVSGSDWVSGTTLTGLGPANSVVTLRHYRWISTTQFYRLTIYTATVNSSGVWIRTVPVVLTTPRDYWQVWHKDGGITHVQGVLTRRLVFPVVRR